MSDDAKYLHRISHKRIDPPPVTATTPLPKLIEEAFLSYNAGRLREACRLFTTKMLADDATVGLSLSGALTPAGLAAPAWCRWSRPALSTGSPAPAQTFTTTHISPSAWPCTRPDLASTT